MGIESLAMSAQVVMAAVFEEDMVGLNSTRDSTVNRPPTKSTKEGIISTSIMLHDLKNRLQVGSYRRRS